MSGLTIAATNTSSPFSVNAASGSAVTLNAGTQVVIALDRNTAQAGVYQTAINAGLLVLTSGSPVTFADGATAGLGEVDVASGEELVLTAAPEPTSLLLAAVAAAPLALGRRRRSAGRR